MQSKSLRFLFEADLDSADAVAVFANLLDVIVADVEQEFAERLVDLPIWLDLHFDIEAEMCQIRKEIRYEDDVARSAYFRLCLCAQGKFTQDIAGYSRQCRYNHELTISPEVPRAGSRLLSAQSLTLLPLSGLAGR